MEKHIKIKYIITLAELKKKFNIDEPILDVELDKNNFTIILELHSKEEKC